MFKTQNKSLKKKAIYDAVTTFNNVQYQLMLLAHSQTNIMIYVLRKHMLHPHTHTR